MVPKEVPMGRQAACQPDVGRGAGRRRQRARAREEGPGEQQRVRVRRRQWRTVEHLPPRGVRQLRHRKLRRQQQPVCGRHPDAEHDDAAAPRPPAPTS